MKKVLKLCAVFAVLVLGLCLVGCEQLTNENEKTSVKNVPAELTTDNAEEVLGKGYRTKTSVKIPDGVKTISYGIFNGSTTLQSITIPESVTHIVDHGGWSWSQGPFRNCTALKSIVLPSKLTYLGSYAFEGCTALESVSIPNDIPSIRSGIFNNCISLKSVSFPASIVSISDNMCNGCLSLTSVTISEGIKEIGNSSFRNCKALRKITLPSTTLKIYDDVFRDCTALASVTVKAEIPPTLGGSVFYNNQTDRKIYVPADSVEAYKTAAGWKNYADNIEAIY